MPSDVIGVFLDIAVGAAALLTVVLVIVLWMRASMRARQPQISIDEIENRTGREDLETYQSAWTAELRWKFLESVRMVQDWVRAEYSGERDHDAADPLGLEHRASVRNSTKARQDEALQTLMTSLQGGTAREIAVPLQIITELVATPRGSLVTATLRQRAKEGRDQLGLAVEITDLSGSLRSRHTFWEHQPQSTDDGGTAEARHAVDELLDAAAFWIAVESAATFLRPRRRWVRRKRRSGLVDNLLGLVYQAAHAWGERGKEFQEMAVEKFEASVRAHPHDHHPYMNLGLTLMDLALAEDDGQPDEDCLRRSMSAYTQSIAVARRSRKLRRRKEQAFVVHRLEEALAFVQLHSKDPGTQNQALVWIGSEARGIERDRRHLQRYTYRFEPVSIYNVACMWALAARSSGDPTWRKRALKILGVALVKDPESHLWSQALSDDDLSVLGDAGERAAFEDRLRKALRPSGVGDQPTVRTAARLERIVEAAMEDVGRPPSSRHRGGRRPPRSSPRPPQSGGRDARQRQPTMETEGS
jgi:hypothetical protein